MLTPNEIADFTVKFAYSSNDIEDKTLRLFLSVEQIPGTIGASSIDPEVQEYLRELEYYYTDNLGGAITYGVCSIFGAVGFAFGSIDVIKKGVSKLSELRNFSSADALNAINRLNDTLKSAVEQMFEKYKVQLENITKNTISKINSISINTQEAFKRFNKRLQEGNDFFSTENLNAIKEKIEAQLANLASQFENITSDKILFVMFRACKLSNEIEDFVKRPIDDLKSFSEGMDLADKIVKINDTRQSLNSIVTGNWRVSPEERKTRILAASSRINSRSSITSYPSINVPMTEAEMQMIVDLTESGNEFFEFSAAVKEMGSTAQAQFQNTGILEYWDDTENQLNSGWKFIVINRPEVFVKLSRVSKRLGEKLLVNSAYRSPWYNLIYLRRIQGNTGAAHNSMHMYGNALDISVRGSITHSDLIRAASVEGFEGIGVYNTFVHMDTNSDRRYWSSKSGLSEEEKQLLLAHSDDKFRKGLA